MDFIFYNISFGHGIVNVLVSTMHISSYAIRVQHVYFSEYLLIKNNMAVKVYIDFFTITVSI